MDWGAASSVLSKTTVADPAQVLQETRVARALMTLLELLIVHSQTLFLLFVLAPAPADRGPLASRHARLTDDGVALAEHASANAATATAVDDGSITGGGGRGGQWRWGWLVRTVAPLATALYADGTSLLGALPLQRNMALQLSWRRVQARVLPACTFYPETHYLPNSNFWS